MQTEEEKKHKVVVESSLREIARQLRMNRLEGFRIRKECSSAATNLVIDKIMEDEE